MFDNHPELFNLFNPANQRDGGQPLSLATSVLAYADHIDHPERLGRMVERIAGKHGSLEVRAEFATDALEPPPQSRAEVMG